MMRYIIKYYLLAMCISVGFVHAQPLDPSEQPYYYQGTIKDGTTRKLLSGVTVKVNRKTCSTDTLGFFRIGPLSRGKYNLKIFKDGYLPVKIDGFNFPTYFPNVYKESFLYNINDLIITQINKHDQVVGCIAGFITGTCNYERDRLPGAVVQIVGTSYGCLTDGYGTFVLPNIPAGKYVINVHMMGFVAQIFKCSVFPNKITYINTNLELLLIPGLEQEGSHSLMIDYFETGTVRKWNEKEIKRMPGN